MDVEAAMEMQRHLDETGLSLHHLCMSYHWVCTMFAPSFARFCIEQTILILVCKWFAQVFTRFAQGVHTNQGFVFAQPLDGKYANSVQTLC